MKFRGPSDVARFAKWLAAALAWCLLSESVYSQPARPAVALALSGDWPAALALEVRKDLTASLNERGVVVLGENDPAAKATLRISPPAAGEPAIRVEVIDPGAVITAVRELSLTAEYPDTWSVVIAATADELLAAAWSLPPVAGVPAEPQAEPLAAVVSTPVPPKPKAEPLPKPPAPSARRSELGFGVGFERYLPNALTYGADVFVGVALSERWLLELGGSFRELVPQSSLGGEVYGTAVGGDVQLRASVTRGSWLGIDVHGGVHAARVWFDGRPQADAVAKEVNATLVSARLGGRALLFTSTDTRLGLGGTAGLPLVSATASAAGKDVLELRGVELGARLEAAWLF